jgi:hypothetical protein
MIQQVIERATLRVKERRARALDLLALNLSDKPLLYRFRDSLEDLLSLFEEEEEFLNLTHDIENIYGWEQNEFWKNIIVISQGYLKYNQNTGEIKSLVEDKNKEQVEGMLEKIVTNRDSLSGSDPEYWNLCEFFLRYRMASLSLKPFFCHIKDEEHEKDFELVGIEEYVNWRETEKCKLDAHLFSTGWDNSPEAILFQKEREKAYLAPLQKRFFHCNPIGPPDNGSHEDIFPRYFALEYQAIPWTKHNRLFYDKSSPPDPVTIGYSFEFLYRLPETFPSHAKPSYRVDKVSYDWAFLTFSFKPVYHDITFKIPNMTWGMMHRGNGFLCKYEDGILVLRFWFKELKHLSTKFFE